MDLIEKPLSVHHELDDLLRPEALADPYAIYDTLRADDPVHWNARLDSWMYLRYQDVLEGLAGHRRLSSDRTDAFMGHLEEADRVTLAPFAGVRKDMMLYCDPPKHTRLRSLVSRALTPRMISAMEPRLAALVDELLDHVEPLGCMDVVKDLGQPLPIFAAAGLLGVPDADRGKLKTWTADFIAAINAGGAAADRLVLARGQASVLAMIDYFRWLAARRRLEPQPDLMTALVQTVEGSSLATESEMLATCIVFLFAGFETSLNLIGNGMLALLREPEQARALEQDPTLVPVAVEELLRYDAPLQVVGRMATEDFELHGRRIRKGDKVLLTLGAANRDPARFPDPSRLDVGRARNQHLAFSHGIHYCPGAPLARLEGICALSAVLRRLKHLRLEEGDLRWQANVSFRGLTALPVSFEARA